MEALSGRLRCFRGGPHVMVRIQGNVERTLAVEGSQLGTQLGVLLDIHLELRPHLAHAVPLALDARQHAVKLGDLLQETAPV